MDKYYPKIVDNQLDQLGRLWKVTKEDLNNTNIISILGDVSHYRGGDSSVGSIIWRDVRELISKKIWLSDIWTYNDFKTDSNK